MPTDKDYQRALQNYREYMEQVLNPDMARFNVDDALKGLKDFPNKHGVPLDVFEKTLATESTDFNDEVKGVKDILQSFVVQREPDEWTSRVLKYLTNVHPKAYRAAVEENTREKLKALNETAFLDVDHPLHRQLQEDVPYHLQMDFKPNDMYAGVSDHENFWINPNVDERGYPYSSVALHEQSHINFKDFLSHDWQQHEKLVRAIEQDASTRGFTKASKNLRNPSYVDPGVNKELINNALQILNKRYNLIDDQRLSGAR